MGGILCPDEQTRPPHPPAGVANDARGILARLGKPRLDAVVHPIDALKPGAGSPVSSPRTRIISSASGSASSSNIAGDFRNRAGRGIVQNEGGPSDPARVHHTGAEEANVGNYAASKAGWPTWAATGADDRLKTIPVRAVLDPVLGADALPGDQLANSSSKASRRSASMEF